MNDRRKRKGRSADTGGAESREVTPTDIQVQNLIDSIEGGLVVIVHRRGYSVGR